VYLGRTITDVKLIKHKRPRKGKKTFPRLIYGFLSEFIALSAGPAKRKLSRPSSLEPHELLVLGLLYRSSH
jgi:hypothetical protein